MSVAFRRESDDEHLEPKFEIPLPVGPNLVTRRGLALTEAKVAELEAMLPAIARDDARKSAARDLRYWRTRLATAQVVPDPSGEVVAIGTTVRFLVDGVERTLHIVGHDEADPAADRIAFSSPLARAIMNGEPGDLLSFQGRANVIEILAVQNG